MLQSTVVHLLALKPVIVSRVLPNSGNQVDELLVVSISVVYEKHTMGRFFTSKRHDGMDVNPFGKDNES